MPQLSGPIWVNRFPTSTRVSDLTANFSASVEAFIGSLEAGGARVSIAATYRPPERAFLMHYSWRLGHGEIVATNVPSMAGVDIDWVHRDRQGRPNATASRAAAAGMAGLYGIEYAPSLSTRHTQRRAIDMTITQYTGKTFADADGIETRVRTASELYALGRTFGVIKLVVDRPHWSDDGH